MEDILKEFLKNNPGATLDEIQDFLDDNDIGFSEYQMALVEMSEEEKINTIIEFLEAKGISVDKENLSYYDLEDMLIKHTGFTIDEFFKIYTVADIKEMIEDIRIPVEKIGKGTIKVPTEAKKIVMDVEIAQIKETEKEGEEVGDDN